MAQSSNNIQKATLAISSASAIASAVALLRNRSNIVEANGPVSLDDMTMQLLIALAASNENTVNVLSQILELLRSSPGEESQTNIGHPEYPNNDHTVSFAVTCQLPNKAYQLPDIEIPPGRNFVVKGYPTNAGIVYVATGAFAAVNWQQAWPLLPNESTGYRIKNPNCLWVSAQVPGDILICTVEQDN